MEQNSINSSLYQESLGRLSIRFMSVLIIAIGCYLLTQAVDSLQSKAIISIITIFVFLGIPRLFYYRYKKVIINEELKINFKPKGFWERLIFATRKTLAAPFIILLTSLIAFNTLITQNKAGLLIICSSFVFYIAFEFVLNTPFFSKFFKADKIPSVYPFYRRWMSIILTSIVSFILGLLVIEPAYNQEEAFKVIASAVTTDISNTNSYFLIFMQSLDITVGLNNYVLGLTANTSWYMLAKAILIALPFSIFSIHISLSLSLLTLSRYRIKQTLEHQDWVPTKGNFILRHWKTAALPLFLIAFFGSIYHFGYPYYIKYQDKILMLEQPKEVTADAEIISDEYYKLGTIKAITDAKQQAIAQLKALLNCSVNDTKASFNDSLEMSSKFATWFVNRSKQAPFKPHDKQLKQAVVSMLNLKNLHIQLESIRKDLRIDTYAVYENLVNLIDITLKNNLLKKKKDGIYTAKLAESNNFISILDLSPTMHVDINKPNEINILQVDLEKELISDIDDPNSIWFEHILSTEAQNLESDLLDSNNHNSSNSFSNRLTTYLTRIINNNTKLLIENYAQNLSLPLDDSIELNFSRNTEIIDNQQEIENDDLQSDELN